MWHIEGLDRGACKLFVPIVFPRFATRALAEADVKRLWSKAIKDGKLKFLRVIDEQMGQFYCLDRRDPRYPSGTAQHRWQIFTTFEGHSPLGPDYATGSEAEQVLERLRSRYPRDVLTIEPSRRYFNLREDDDANNPRNYRWIQLHEGQKVHLVNTVFPKATLCGLLIKHAILGKIIPIPSEDVRCYTCVHSNTMQSRVKDALIHDANLAIER